MTIRVEVVYALAHEQVLLALDLPPGATAIEAVQASGLLQRYPQLRQARLELGIYAEPVAHDQPLAEGDRVEIYRPLLLDPRDRRRRRAAD